MKINFPMPLILAVEVTSPFAEILFSVAIEVVALIVSSLETSRFSVTSALALFKIRFVYCFPFVASLSSSQTK